MLIRFISILFAAHFLLFAAAKSEAVERSAAEGMLIRADKMGHDTVSDALTATGNVEMTWQDMSMTCDQATYNRETKLLIATGNVYIVKAGDVMWGQRLFLDTETGRAEMENGRIFMTQGNFYGDGKHIARRSEEDYSFLKGGLTTCDATVPSWKFGAADLDLTVEDYATGSNVIFYVKDIPVFYFPYIVLPVKRERQSGFLLPKFGNSTKKGVSADIPFYWAINDSQEATIDLDIQSKRGVGLGVDYRYLRKRGSEGSAGGYAINDQITKELRGQFLQYHKEVWPENLTLITSINLTSDPNFLSDYSEKSGEYNRQYYDSRIVLTKHWNNWLTTLQGIYTQDFYTTSNTTTLQRLPELSLFGVREQILDLPLYNDTDIIATNYYREKGMLGQREVAVPRLTLNHGFFDDRVNTWIQGGVQLRAYQVRKADDGVSGKSTVAVPFVEAGLSVPVSRVFQTEIGDLKAMRHEIVPAIRYSNVANVNQSKTPIFDHFDRIAPQNVVYLEITSHLGTKFQKEEGPAVYRDLSLIRLTQGYSFQWGRQDLLTSDQDKPVTDLFLETETTVHKNLQLLADAQYDHYLNRIVNTTLGARFNNQDGTTATVNYRWNSQQVDYLEGTLVFAYLRPVYLGYSARYSFDGKKVLSSDYSIEYRHQCWSTLFTYTQRPDDWSWSVSFNLAGLFSIGSASASNALSNK